MQKNAKYAVAHRNGYIAVSLDEVENLLERRRPADLPERDGSDGPAGRDNPTHQRRATDRPHNGSRREAHEAGRHVRGLLSRAWHALFPPHGVRGDSSAP